MTSPIKTLKSVLKVSTDTISNIPALPIGFAEILAIINVKFDDNSKYFLYLDVVLLLVKEVTESKQSLLVKTVINLA
jgi:hypothetical protein